MIFAFQNFLSPTFTVIRITWRSRSTQKNLTLIFELCSLYFKIYVPLPTSPLYHCFFLDNSSFSPGLAFSLIQLCTRVTAGILTEKGDPLLNFMNISVKTAAIHVKTQIEQKWCSQLWPARLVLHLSVLHALSSLREWPLKILGIQANEPVNSHAALFLHEMPSWQQPFPKFTPESRIGANEGRATACSYVPFWWLTIHMRHSSACASGAARVTYILQIYANTWSTASRLNMFPYCCS